MSHCNPSLTPAYFFNTKVILYCCQPVEKPCSSRLSGLEHVFQVDHETLGLVLLDYSFSFEILIFYQTKCVFPGPHDIVSFHTPENHQTVY